MGKRNQMSPCNCVLRAIFRACYMRFRDCSTKEKYLSRVSLHLCASGRDGKHSYSRLDEEYTADFCMVSKRSLTPHEYRVFSAHFLLGADWRLCCRQLKMDRGSFFHDVYRIQQKLGRIFRELQPYGLFPLDQYFGGTIDKSAARKAVSMPAVRDTKPLRPPVRKAA